MAFIDKINPDLPEGRLLIRNGEFILKYPDAEVSKVPFVNGNQKCSDFGNSECSIFGIKTTVLFASAVQ